MKICQRGLISISIALILVVIGVLGEEKDVPAGGSLEAQISTPPKVPDNPVHGWITGGRRTKVLEQPLESQLHFGATSSKRNDEINLVDFMPTSLSPSNAEKEEQRIVHVEQESPSQVSQQIVAPARVVSTTHITSRKSSTTIRPVQKRRLRPRPRRPIRRQGGPTEAPPVELTSVSPIESSFGGLTGLQGLPPLSFIQFLKLLIAVTPFFIPIVFVPLLIFTIGVFMIPVTKQNVFLDLYDLRSYQASLSESVLGYLDSAKSWASKVPEKVNQVAKNVVDHEECVERISCEVSARLLPSQWDGSWRSVLNKGWISKALNLWRNPHPMVARIARSLDSKPTETTEESRHLSQQSCNRYACQAKNLFCKFFKVKT